MVTVALPCRCKLGDVGLKALREALEENATLRELDLSWNEFGASGLTSLSEAMSINTKLETLDLSWCSLKDTCADYLAHMIKANMGMDTTSIVFPVSRYIGGATPKNYSFLLWYVYSSH